MGMENYRISQIYEYVINMHTQKPSMKLTNQWFSYMVAFCLAGLVEEHVGPFLPIFTSA